MFEFVFFYTICSAFSERSDPNFPENFDSQLLSIEDRNFPKGSKLTCVIYKRSDPDPYFINISVFAPVKYQITFFSNPDGHFSKRSDMYLLKNLIHMFYL